MVKLSIIILTFNEEEVLESAINSVSWADEILVVDSGSTDRTKSIAQRHKVRWIYHPFTNFSNQRNLAFKQSKGEYIFYLDADEQITPELRQSIQTVIKQSQRGAYHVVRMNYYLGRPWPKQECLDRFFKREGLIGWYGRVHESARFQGKSITLKGYLLHQTHRSLESMLKKTLEWSLVEAEERLAAHHPPVTWWRLLRIMLTTFFAYFIKQRGFTVGTVGLIESLYQSYSSFITYARLWELQEAQN